MPVDPTVGRTWIAGSLESGGSLSRQLRGSVDLQRGRVQAVLPAEENADRPERGFGARDASSALLLAFLRESYGLDVQLVVEDELLRRSDHQDVRKFGTPVVFYEDEVLHVQRLSAFDTSDALEEFLNWASAGHPLNAFLVAANALDPKSWNGTADQAALQRVAGNVELVIVGAYDADGFLVWSPDSQTS